MIEAIKYKPCLFKGQKVTDVQVCEVELFENHIRWQAKFYADEPKDKDDYDLGWESVFNHIDIAVKKQNIAALEMGYSQTNKAWYVMISISGMSADILLYVKHRSEAQEIHDKLYEYIFDNN